MNEDFEEEYDDDDDGLQDFQDAIDKGRDAKDKFNKEKEARDAKKAENNGGNTSSSKGNNSPQPSNIGNEPAKQAGKEATKQAGKETAKGAGKEVAKEAGKEVAKEAGKQAATKGAITAAEAIPYVGAVIAAIDAAISMIKAINKHDKKMREKGIDTKNMRRLFLASPLLMPILIVVLIIVILTALSQGTTIDRVDIIKDALVCFETSGAGEGCEDFMNTGVTFGKYRLREKIFSEGIDEGWLIKYPYSSAKPLIKRTDKEISWFLSDFLLIEKALNVNVDFEFLDPLTDLIPLNDSFDDTAEYDSSAMASDMRESGLLTEDDPDEIQETDVGKRQAYLFKWLKMEKKIFNQIQWRYVSIHRTSISWLNDMGDALTFTVFNKLVDPADELRKAVSNRQYSWVELGVIHRMGNCLVGSS